MRQRFSQSFSGENCSEFLSPENYKLVEVALKEMTLVCHSLRNQEAVVSTSV